MDDVCTKIINRGNTLLYYTCYIMIISAANMETPANEICLVATMKNIAWDSRIEKIRNKIVKIRVQIINSVF